MAYFPQKTRLTRIRYLVEGGVVLLSDPEMTQFLQEANSPEPYGLELVHSYCLTFFIDLIFNFNQATWM